jgi:hypothetical protein
MQRSIRGGNPDYFTWVIVEVGGAIHPAIIVERVGSAILESCPIVAANIFVFVFMGFSV